MPELPDITVYIEALKTRLIGQPVLAIRLASPFVVRSVRPPISALSGRKVCSIRRLGKQIVFAFEEDLFLVLHLMIAGRLQWKGAGAPIPGKIGLVGFDFEQGTLILTEAGSRKRASVHVVEGEDNLKHFDRAALEVLDANEQEFRSVLLSENHTVKRALTDPRLFSGIGNAYSDEILHEARLSPLKLTSKLAGHEVSRLFGAVRTTLTRWVELLREQTGSEFPSKVTAFRPEMSVHGRYGKPCPRCGSPVQRIVYAENECNYCPVCQTEGKLLADRAMSRLLKNDWPRSLDELDRHFEERKEPSG